MEIDEAIKKYKKLSNKERGRSDNCADEAEQLVNWLEELKALKEKYKPKKPEIIGGVSLSEQYFECPACRHNNGMPNQFKKYCRNCGQAILW